MIFSDKRTETDMYMEASEQLLQQILQYFWSSDGDIPVLQLKKMRKVLKNL